MTDPSASNDAEDGLTTTLPVLVLPCILAVASGALLHYSSFFGGTLVVVFFCSLIYALYRIGTATHPAVKNLEVWFIGLSIPLLATLSAIITVPEIPFAVPLPAAAHALNLLLMAIAVAHSVLLKRTGEQLNQTVLLGYSATLIVASVIGTGIIWGRWGFGLWEDKELGWEHSKGVPYGFPTCGLIIYALGPFIDSTFRLREKIPVSTMESGTLLVSFAGFAGCIVSSIYLPVLLPGLILATLVCALLYVRLDILEHQMRIPHAEWTEQTATNAYRQTALKVLPLVTVAAWAAMGACGSWAFREDAAERKATCGTTSREKCKGTGTRFLLLFIFSSLAMFGQIAMLDTELPLIRGHKIDMKSSFGIAAAVAAVVMKVAIAGYYLFCPHVTLPAWAAMTVVGSLCLLVAFLLDNMRACLLRYNIPLLLASIGLGIYFFATGMHLNDADTPADTPPYLGIFFTGFVVCALLVAQIGMAMVEQDNKEEKMKEDPAYFSNNGVQ